MVINNNACRLLECGTVAFNMTYSEITQQHAPCENCFFAFSNEQFKEGLAKAGLSENDKIYSAGHGLYGTRDGIQKFFSFYDEQDKRIAAECDPQSVYDYEFVNHECSYTNDDREAFAIVVRIFGEETAGSVKRRYAYS